ncbi:BRCT domain-containing protein [Pseudomonas putida]|uniref:BRCT domain-containing protein n=1 Tax=Pseudomonas putida TaxID=303 RepID=UPI0018D85D59|nr:BRCT domain-containing protein [Pseudomonas putida]MBH3350840.1 BRCT domain-containing protein [Pseudomonas putida]MBS5848000.1 BRCT domain-containing protein [Pseudomonas putida]MCE0881646.1 BRCT domain-containing protein [Pseudomonas putida]
MVDLYQEFQNSRFFHEARIAQRSVDALIGIAAGLTADNQVNQQEAEFLRGWMEQQLIHLEDPVINLLYRRLSDMLQDNVLDATESAELLELLQQFTGEPRCSDNPFSSPSTLPLDCPEPTLEWRDRTFLFTGTMAYGPRKDCEALVIERGGAVAAGVSKKIHYLVIGSIGNDQWLHSIYGTKIKKAVEIREAGANIAIVSEAHWQRAAFG